MAEYKINVELALTNTAFLAALTAISRHLGHIRTQQKDIEGGFRAWHLAAAGVTGLFISGAMAKGFADVTLAAKGVTEELIRMQMQGQKAADIQANWKEAFRVSGITGQPIEQVLSEMGKMSYYTADPEEARALSEKISKMEIVLQAVTGKESKGLVPPLLKALEEVGILGVGGREGDLAKLLELFTKDLTATKGE